MKVLVTGGAGFLGSHLARHFVNRGHDVLVVDNLSTGSLQRVSDLIGNSRFRYQISDLRLFKKCKRATKNVDLVIHTAADMGGIGYITRVGADVMSNNLTMNSNMLRASVDAGVDMFMYCSSACVYPEFKQSVANVQPLKESDAIPASPDTPYGWEKLATERMCMAYCKDYGLDVKIARIHNVYGVGSSYSGGREKAPAALCRKAILYPKEPFTIWGDGNQTRSFLYIDDFVRAVDVLLNSDLNVPVNVGSDRLISINDLARIIIEISGKDIEVRHDLSNPQGVRGRNADITVMRSLGWEPIVSLEDGLEKLYRWIEKDMFKRRIQR